MGKNKFNSVKGRVFDEPMLCSVSFFDFVATMFFAAVSLGLYRLCLGNENMMFGEDTELIFFISAVFLSVTIIVIKIRWSNKRIRKTHQKLWVLKKAFRYTSDGITKETSIRLYTLGVPSEIEKSWEKIEEVILGNLEIDKDLSLEEFAAMLIVLIENLRGEGIPPIKSIQF